MEYLGRHIDHIVYCVPNFEQAIDDLEKKLGCPINLGGRHLNQGTKNALLNLGAGCYFEILAIDQSNDSISAPRWMGIDLITEPCITRWALKSTQLESDLEILKKHNTELAKSFQGERAIEDGTLLQWQMSLPAAHPKIELAPFFLDWSKSDFHPTEKLPNYCSLEKIEFQKVKTNTKIDCCFDELFTETIFEEAQSDRIMISIKGPNGILKI